MALREDCMEVHSSCTSFVLQGSSTMFGLTFSGSMIIRTMQTQWSFTKPQQAKQHNRKCWLLKWSTLYSWWLVTDQMTRTDQSKLGSSERSEYAKGKNMQLRKDTPSDCQTRGVILLAIRYQRITCDGWQISCTCPKCCTPSSSSPTLVLKKRL